MDKDTLTFIAAAFIAGISVDRFILSDRDRFTVQNVGTSGRAVQIKTDKKTGRTWHLYERDNMWLEIPKFTMEELRAKNALEAALAYPPDSAAEPLKPFDPDAYLKANKEAAPANPFDQFDKPVKP